MNKEQFDRFVMACERFSHTTDVELKQAVSKKNVFYFNPCQNLDIETCPSGYFVCLGTEGIRYGVRGGVFTSDPIRAQTEHQFLLAMHEGYDKICEIAYKFDLFYSTLRNVVEDVLRLDISIEDTDKKHIKEMTIIRSNLTLVLTFTTDGFSHHVKVDENQTTEPETCQAKNQVEYALHFQRVIRRFLEM